MTRRRVVMVTNVYAPRIGGITQYVSDLVRGLEARGVACEVLAMPEAFNRLDEANRGRRGWWRTIHLVFAGVFVARCLVRIVCLRISGERPLLHSHSASYCLFVAFVARLLGCPALHTFHSPLDTPLTRLRALTQRIDAIVFVSESMRAQYASAGVRHQFQGVVPGGVDLTRFHPSSPDDRRLALDLVDRYLGTSNRAPIVLFVGRIVPEKGVDILIAAAIELARMGLDLRVLLVGPFDESTRGAEYAHRCRDIVRRSEIDGLVTFTGPVPASELPVLYRASTVFVCPSTWAEPATLVVPEALASGIPAVVSCVGGLPERVQDGVDGIVVAPGDARALAVAIARLLREPPLLERMSRAAADIAASEFPLERMVDYYLAVYRRIGEPSSGTSR